MGAGPTAEEKKGGGPAWLPPALFPFDRRFLEIGGARIHYVDEGAGLPLLMLHGNPTWSFVYRDVIRTLRDDFRCIAPDYPGFGLSEPPAEYGFTPPEHARTLLDFIAALDLRDIVLVAHDWGGPIGLWAAENAPHRFRGLVIGNSWAWPLTGRLKFELFSRLMNGPVPLTRLIPLGLKRKSLTRSERTAYQAPFQTPGSPAPMRTLVAALRTAAPFLQTVENGLPPLAHLPVLLLWGAKDPAFGMKERRRFETAFPRAKTLVLPDCGHLVPKDAPEEMAAAIRKWTGQNGTERGDFKFR